MAPLTFGKTRGKGLLQCEEEQKKKYQIYSSIQADRTQKGTKLGVSIISTNYTSGKLTRMYCNHCKIPKVHKTPK